MPLIRLLPLALALGAATASARAPGGDVTAPVSTPTPTAGAPKPDDAARWNDRTTPRKTLETFYFAITGYDFSAPSEAPSGFKASMRLAGPTRRFPERPSGTAS